KNLVYCGISSIRPVKILVGNTESGYGSTGSTVDRFNGNVCGNAVTTTGENTNDTFVCVDSGAGISGDGAQGSRGTNNDARHKSSAHIGNFILPIYFSAAHTRFSAVEADL